MPAIRRNEARANLSAGPSKDPARPAQRKMKVHNKYNTGDFEITSDNTTFLIPSFHMLAASSVMRDTYAIGTPGSKFQLPLCDTASPIVEIFLDIIVDREAAVTEQCGVAELQQVLGLCEKFDCPGVVKAVMVALDDYIQNCHNDRLAILQATATPVGHRQFEKCIRRSGQGGRFPTIGLVPALNTLPGESQIRDPTTWSIIDFSRLPHNYLWALLRSHRLSRNNDDQADKLKVLLGLIAGPGTAPSGAGSPD